MKRTAAQGFEDASSSASRTRCLCTRDPPTGGSAPAKARAAPAPLIPVRFDQIGHDRGRLSQPASRQRTQMRTEIRELQRQAGITSVFVTHDQEEAMAIADRIGVMNHGKLEQLGSAEDLYKRPVSRFVAGFIGKCNFIEGRVTGAGKFATANGQVLRFSGEHAGGPAALCFRPEHAALGQSGAAGTSAPVTITSVTYLGPVTEYEAVSEAGDKLLVTAPSSSNGASPKAGDKVALTWRVEDAFVVD